MSAPLDYSANVYLAISLTANSVYLNKPVSIPSYPYLSYLGNVGQLADVKLVSVPKDDWQNIGEDILAYLRADKDNIARVDVQMPATRRKRGRDEL